MMPASKKSITSNQRNETFLRNSINVKTTANTNNAQKTMIGDTLSEFGVLFSGNLEVVGITWTVLEEKQIRSSKNLAMKAYFGGQRKPLYAF